MNCAICFDSFNKSTRAPTKCPYCDTQLCRTCLQTYLLNDISDTPRCVNSECGHGFEREFLDSQTTKAFRLHSYKEHREKVLSDRERARLPATQEDAAEYQLAKIVSAEERLKYADLYKQKIAIQGQIEESERKMYRARAVIDTYGKLRMVQVAKSENTEKKATFIKPCPADDCKGFLSTAWKCGLCEKWTCPECHELKGLDRDIEHTCDADKVATALLLAREAKSCPKCGVQICKIEGCDQMWCTVCNTGFNWRTGKMALGPVHNPHYFEYLRKQGIESTGPTNVPVNCDYEMDRNVAKALGSFSSLPLGRRSASTNTDDRYLLEIWRLMREMQGLYANRDDTNPDETFRQMRVRYMVGELSEDDWKCALQRSEKDAHFKMAKNQVKDVFIHAARDIIRGVLEPTHDKSVIRKQIEELVEYCNKSYKDISSRFNRKITLIKVVNSISKTAQPDLPNVIVHT